MSNVLITNGQQRKSLSVARSLGRKGIGVVCCETNSINPTRYSKYCKKFFKHPDPNIYTDEFINVVTEGIKSNSCSVLIPTDDDTILAVEKNSNIFSKICKFAIPPQKDFYTAFNKGEMVKIAKKAGAYIPETVFVNDIGMLPEITEHLKFPVVIKPVISSGSRGIRVVSEKEKFIDEYLKTHSTYPYPIIQEYIDGDEKFDVCLIYNKKSQLRASFVQKRSGITQ